MAAFKQEPAEPVSQEIPDSMEALNDARTQQGIRPIADHANSVTIKGTQNSHETTIDALEEDVTMTHFGFWAFLRSMAAIAWGTFRHPFSTTFVDISTGEAVHLPSNVLVERR